jgi:hypothetical protein
MVTTDGISTWTCSATSAGGSASETVTIQRDTVRPVVECGNTPTFVVGQSPALVTATASDALSGLQGEPVLQRDVSTTTAGQHDVRFSVLDLARNGRAVLCDYVVVQNATALDAHPVLLKLTGRVSVNFPLGAKLTSSGLPLAGQPVSFSIAGRQRCTAVTNTSGFATCGTVLDWLTALLSGGFTATYAGTPVYSGSTDSAGLIG